LADVFAGGASEGGVDLHMAARDTGLEYGAEVAFQGIEFRGQVEMQVQPAVVDALETED